MRGYLGLGSNVGDRRANLQAAIDALPAHGVIVLACSSTYDTDPVGEILDQPSFLNACARVETALAPEELLDACKDDRARAGARPRERRAPRAAPDRRRPAAARRRALRLRAPDAAPRAGHAAALRAHPAARARLRPADPRRDAAERLPGARMPLDEGVRREGPPLRLPASGERPASRRSSTAPTSARAASWSSAVRDVERGLVERAHEHVGEGGDRLGLRGSPASIAASQLVLDEAEGVAHADLAPAPPSRGRPGRRAARCAGPRARCRRRASRRRRRAARRAGRSAPEATAALAVRWVTSASTCSKTAANSSRLSANWW